MCADRDLNISPHKNPPDVRAVPTSVTRAELDHLVATVGESDGWDFSRVKMDHGPEPWEYEDVVRQFLRPTDRVLDVGTGRGERFIALADAYAEGIGVDHDPIELQSARRNRPDSLRDQISFDVMDGRALTFDPDAFDAVLTRNARFWPDQIVKVLRRGGYFVCEQIGEQMNQPIFDAFGWGTNGAYWRQVFANQGDPLPSQDEYLATFEALDCRVVATGHIEHPAWFCDLESLVFYMKAAPFPENFDSAVHLEPFNRYLATAAGPHGYQTNGSSDLLVVQRR